MKETVQPIRPTEKKILIITGESSGDNLAYDIIRQLQKNKDIHLFAMGGAKLQKTSTNIIFDSSNLGIIGFTAIPKHIVRLTKALLCVKNFIKTHKPDLVILIDYPGFNLKVAKYANGQQCPVYYYVSPQLWAWRPQRINHIKKHITKIAVLFEFEKELYIKAGIPVSFVGHPLASKTQVSTQKPGLREEIGIDKNQKLIAILPGSRDQEWKHNLPVLLETCEKIASQHNHVHFLFYIPPKMPHIDVPHTIQNHTTIHRKQNQNILSICDFAIAVSGTITLELLLLEVPHIIIYKTSSLNYALAKRLIKTPHIGLCNIVAKTQIAVELIQNEATSENILSEAQKLLSDTVYKKRKTTTQLASKELRASPHSEDKILKDIYEIIFVKSKSHHE